MDYSFNTIEFNTTISVMVQNNRKKQITPIRMLPMKIATPIAIPATMSRHSLRRACWAGITLSGRIFILGGFGLDRFSTAAQAFPAPAQDQLVHLSKNAPLFGRKHDFVTILRGHVYLPN
ncbi:MAG: hypothetical protein DPW18_01755 [Chloroflexi bacterium]|nr:hypothetical protein [Chloroflexota bacterium]